jgi:hypothetical protein
MELMSDHDDWINDGRPITVTMSYGMGYLLEPLPTCVRGVLSDRAADVELARAGHRYVLPSLATSVAWRCAGGYSRAEIWDELKRQIPEVFA